MLLLRLFGGLSLETDGDSIPPQALQRRRLTLLAMLALAGDRGMSRERIQAYLWPESPADRARHALDQLLYATRRDLGPDTIRSTASDLRLDCQAVRADTVMFGDAVRAGRWAEAAALRGGPLLDGVHLVDGVEFELWVEGERARIDGAYHTALENLAGAAADRGDLREVSRWWRLRAAAEPLSAAVALKLMEALAATGDRAGALQHARAHQQTVRAVLEADADPAVEAFSQALLADVGAGVKLPVPASTPAVEPAATGSAAVPARSGARRFREQRIVAGLLLVFASGLTLFLSRSAAAPPAASPAAVEHGPNGSPDISARRLYLQAETEWNRRTHEGLNQAVVLFRRATDRDPQYAAAYAGMARAYVLLGYFGFGPGEAMFPKADAAARRALALDPASGDAYAALGQVFAWRHQWVEAEGAHRRAIELEPDNATAHQWYALMLAYVGRMAEAAQETAHASQLDPLSVQINNMHGMTLYNSGDRAGALAQFQRTVNTEPDTAWVLENPWVVSNYGTVLASTGQSARGIRLIRRALERLPRHPRLLLDLASAYVREGRLDSARAAFARADTTDPQFGVYRGIFDAIVGDRDAAFARFDSVRTWSLPALVALNGSPELAALRTDPRYHAIRQRLRIPDQGRAAQPR